jgi:hypothetical protein
MSILLPILPLALGGGAALEPEAPASASDCGGWPSCLWGASDSMICWAAACELAEEIPDMAMMHLQRAGADARVLSNRELLWLRNA